MRGFWVAIVLLGIVLVACAQDVPTCTTPYIASGNTCCIDKDADSACDPTGGADAPRLDCSLCPPQFVTQVEEKIIYKYVCPDGSVHDTDDTCPQGAPSNAYLFEGNDAQDETIITAFDARAACRGEYKAAEIHLEVTKSPSIVRLLAKSDPDGGFVQIAELSGNTTIIDDEYYYIGFCDGADCAGVTDAQLSSDTAHLVRAVLEYPDGSVTTRDRLLDPTNEGEMGKKKC
jgi:hypothetical protein